jgi:hypothetical protein
MPWRPSRSGSHPDAAVELKALASLQQELPGAHIPLLSAMKARPRCNRSHPCERVTCVGCEARQQVGPPGAQGSDAASMLSCLTSHRVALCGRTIRLYSTFCCCSLAGFQNWKSLAAQETRERRSACAIGRETNAGEHTHGATGENVRRLEKNPGSDRQFSVGESVILIQIVLAALVTISIGASLLFYYAHRAMVEAHQYVSDASGLQIGVSGDREFVWIHEKYSHSAEIAPNCNPAN